MEKEIARAENEMAEALALAKKIRELPPDYFNELAKGLPTPFDLKHVLTEGCIAIYLRCEQSIKYYKNQV